MNEYEVWMRPPPENGPDWVTVRAEEVDIDNSGRLVFSAADHAVVEVFQPFVWSRWRLAETD
jgi:hypothetical protein